MRTPSRLAIPVLVAALAAAAAFGGDEKTAKNRLPVDQDEALEWAKPAIEAARKAQSAETVDIAKGMRRAVDLLQPFAKKSADLAPWAAAWNEALTLTRFHKNKPTGEYLLEPHLAVTEYLTFGLPKGRGWTYVEGRPVGAAANCWGEIKHLMGDGRTMSTIRISVFEFDCLYTEIGGENATALAKRALDWDKRHMATVESASQTLSTPQLSKHFTRSEYYEIVGTMEKFGRVRLRSYYAKTALRTFLFDVVEFREKKDGDAPVEVWQKTVEDPELEAVLWSIDENAAKKTVR
jgi:hypothetical protein